MDKHIGSSNAGLSRRRLLIGSGLALGAGLLASSKWLMPALAAEGRAPVDEGPVNIVMFDDQGQRVGEREVARVVKTPEQWRQQLSSASYEVTREAGTERAFSGDYEKPDQAGFYRCICCDTAVFDAATQFHSGTGWPSFWQVIAPENVAELKDRGFGMTRTAIACQRCNAHLGHVFHDGPQPTGLRYCMNSVSLRFVQTEAA